MFCTAGFVQKYIDWSIDWLIAFFVASKILSLFFSQVDKVFFGIPYFAATCDFVFPSSTSFNALYLSLMDFVFNNRCDDDESTRIL